MTVRRVIRILSWRCFWLLGYQLSSRLADLGEACFWRLEPAANNGPLNGVARSRVKLAVLLTNPLPNSQTNSTPFFRHRVTICWKTHEHPA